VSEQQPLPHCRLRKSGSGLPRSLCSIHLRRPNPCHSGFKSLGDLAALILAILALGHNVGWWEDGGVVFVAVVHQGFCGTIWGWVQNRLGDVGAVLGVQQEVDEGVRIDRVWRACWNAHAI
jgi:hypothetical protein